MTFRRQASLAACILGVAMAALPQTEQDARVYTNADLERVRPLRY